MKLMLIIISNEDTQDVTKGLLKEKFYVTKLATTGGYYMEEIQLCF